MKKVIYQRTYEKDFMENKFDTTHGMKIPSEQNKSYESTNNGHRHETGYCKNFAKEIPY
jgi:hypothetical protein